jgi:hypothetical protein
MRAVLVAIVVAGGCGRIGFGIIADTSRDAAPPHDTRAADACAAGPTAGLVGWWPFDDGSGTVARDVIGGNDGLLIGGATWGAGHLGGAIALDGMSGHVDISGSTAYATHAAAFSFSAWANLASWQTTTPDIMQMMTDAGSTSPFHVLWSDMTAYDGMSTGDGDASWLSTRTGVEPSLATWHHVAMVYDGTDAQSLDAFTFYLDGAVQPLADAGGYGTQVNVSRIGAAEVSENYWTGSIDDVRVYDRALSAAEVAALVAAACD